VGAKSNRMELVVNRLKDENLNFTNLLSNTEDVDMADVLIRLTSEENVYRASLASGARIIQPTLIDFLR
jgi:flagellar hook-associated protein 3 FlgL